MNLYPIPSHGSYANDSLKHRRTPLKFAKRLDPIKPSATLAVTSKAKALKAEGHDVLSFAAGEPDFPTPDFVVDAMIESAAAAVNAGAGTLRPCG